MREESIDVIIIIVGQPVFFTFPHGNIYSAFQNTLPSFFFPDNRKDRDVYTLFPFIKKCLMLHFNVGVGLIEWILIFVGKAKESFCFL